MNKYRVCITSRKEKPMMEPTFKKKGKEQEKKMPKAVVRIKME
jgi:hypothetical protein